MPVEIMEPPSYYDDGDHEMQGEEYRIYNKTALESDGFDYKSMTKQLGLSYPSDQPSYEYEDSDDEILGEEYAIYNNSALESDGFDVIWLGKELGLIQPSDLSSIERSSDVAKFAINYFNRTQGADLQLVKVIKWVARLACPLNHYITFITMENSTGTTKVYQTLVCESFPWEASKVITFREKPRHQIKEAEEVQCLAVFAVHHYNKTEGENLKYMEVTSFEPFESGCLIFFKAENKMSGDVRIYETEIVYGDPMQNSTVKTFRRSQIQWTNRDEEFHFFTSFAIDYYNKTKGERLELVQIVTCDQHDDSYLSTFKARNILSCKVEHYETEVVYAAPEYNPVVKTFRRSHIQWTNRDEEFHFFTSFAIDYYNKTKGERLELVQIVSCDQHDDSYLSTFKARDILSCKVEHYETEVLYAAPEYNQVVKTFIQRENRDEEFHHFTTFAIDHYNKTEGERLKLVQIVTCDYRVDSYFIIFNARDLLGCTVEQYQTEVVCAALEYNPVVTVFEKIYMLPEDEDGRILHFTTFAIDHYNKTKGEHLKLVEIVTCDQKADSCYIITFKGRDLSTCIVEHYQTEIVTAASIQNSAVKVFKKILNFSTDQASMLD